MLSGFFVTKKGKNLLAKTHDGAHIQLTRAEIGNGDVPEDQLVTDVTQLYGKIKELPLKDVKMVSNDTACIPVQFSNKGVLTSFELKEIGIYALDPDDGEILYLYGNTSATGDKPDEIKGESEAPLEYMFNLNLTFDNGKDVKVTVDNGIIYATVQELLDMADTKVDKVTGKGLSTEDYTTGEKNKLTGIEAGANKYVHPSTHPVSMITGLGTAATKDVGTSSGNVVVVNSDGEIDSTLIGSLAHVGTDGYIAYPGGGKYVSSISSVTGMLKITLPVSWTRTMLKFKVSIYNFSAGTSVDYILAGYNHSDNTSWMEPTAYCVSPWGGELSNLPVSFGHDGEKCAVTIGTPTTVWHVPQVVISDVTLGYSGRNYNQWKSGWNLSFVTEALPIVSKTISNTNIAYDVNHADSAVKADKLKTPRSIALTGGATGTAMNFDGSSDISIPVTGLDASKLATGDIPSARLSPDPGVYTSNPQLGPSGVLHASLTRPTLAEVGAVEESFTNKIAFYPYEKALCEISSDGGTTWTIDPNMTETKWKALVSENNNSNIQFTSDKQYRITITTNRYCLLNAIYFYASTDSQLLAIKIEEHNVSENTWTATLAQSTQALGSPAHFWLQHAMIRFYQSNLFNDSVDKVRLTFIPASNQSFNVNLYGLRWYGSFPGTDHRTIYSWDGDKNVTFPAQLSAPNMSAESGNVDNILQVGRTFYNVENFEIRTNVKEIVIYTKIPFTARMPLIHIRGFAYGEAKPIDLKIAFYAFTDTDEFTGYTATANGGWRPDIYLFTYTEDARDYIAVGFKNIVGYFARFTVDLYDKWSNNSNYSKGWTIDYVLSNDTTGKTLILDNRKVQVPYAKTPVEDIGGLGTAATKNTGTTSGSVPVIESSGKLPTAIIPTDGSKQDKLTFDTAPKAGSTNPVTSGGVATALAGKANTSHSQGHDTIAFNPEANKAGEVFPLDRGYVDTSGACRTVFMPADAVTVEYTQDNGVTWKDYGLTDVQKQSLFSMNRGYSINLGGPSATVQTVGHGVRITVSPTDNRYASADMFYCWFGARSSTNKCTIERSTIGAKTTFATIRSDVSVAGDSSSNMITFATGTFGGSAGQTSNNYSYRFTFITTAISTTETTVPKVTDLRLYGSRVWRMPNQMMFDGHLYSWDTAQNATFPAQLKAPAIYDSGQRVYSPSNKPTAADVGALPMDGGTLAGELVPNGGLAHAGIDGYIAYPDGGQYISSIQNVTGMLKITLPVSWTNTMLKFKVSICNSRNKTHAEYIISGYNIENRWSFFDAYCLSPWGGVLSNLPVSFGHDGSKCAITIGTPTTVWNYPQVVISDIMMGYSNTSYDMWKSGWNISFITEALPTVSTTIANTNIGYNVRRADGAATADKVANKLTIGSKTYDGSVAVTLTSEDLSGGATGQTWHAKDILGSGTTSTADATAESGYSVTIDTTAKSLNGSVKKYKAPFGTYVAIFRVQASTVTGTADKVKLEIWGTSASIASRTVKLSDFSTISDWEYFKIPFVTKSTTGREIYPKVTCLDSTGSIKVDTVVVVPNAFALM